MPARRIAASIDHVGAGERAGVRGGGLQAVAGAAGLDDDHRLVARRRARRRHELARRLDRFDVEQDRAGVRVAGEVVEQVAEVDVGALAERDHVREADAPRARPSRAPRSPARPTARRRRCSPGRASVWAKLAFRPMPRRQQAEAVRAEQAQQVRPRGVERRLLLRGAQAGGHDDRRRACRAGRARRPGRARCRAACTARPGRARSAGRPRRRASGTPSSVACFGLTRVDRAGEAAGAQVAPDRRADAAGAVRMRR